MIKRFLALAALFIWFGTVGTVAAVTEQCGLLIAKTDFFHFAVPVGYQVELYSGGYDRTAVITRGDVQISVQDMTEPNAVRTISAHYDGLHSFVGDTVISAVQLLPAREYRDRHNGSTYLVFYDDSEGRRHAVVIREYPLSDRSLPESSDAMEMILRNIEFTGCAAG